MSSTPHPSVSSRWLAVRGFSSTPSFLVAALCLLLLTLTACPAAVLSQQWVHVTPSPTYFADQPIITLTSTNASTATFPLTFNYSSTLPLLLTTAVAVAVSVPGAVGGMQFMPVMQLAAVNSAGFHSYLLTSANLGGTCQRVDSSQQGQCTVVVTLTSPQPQQTVQYSLYTLNQLSYSNIYTDIVYAHTWKYYVKYVQSSDLPVSFTLEPLVTNGQLTTAMYVSAAQQLFSPGYPLYVNNGSVSVNTAAGQGCLLPSTAADVPDYYIVGLYGFASPPTISQLQLVSDVDSSYDSPNFSGYAILSLLSLVLAAGFIGLVLVRGCCVYRRWNTGRGSGSAGHMSYAVDPTRTVYDPAVFHFQTTAGQAGVLRTDRAGMVGATEAEIATLPTKTYVGSGHEDGEEGEEGDEHPRCTICLDEYEPGVSRITTLKCAHSFHTACVGAWLRQRRHCPLCLQLIDQAQDVKQRRNSIVAAAPEVELAAVRPTIAIPSHHAAPSSSRSREPASRTVLDEREDGGSVVGHMGRYSSAAQEEDADMCVVEIGTPQHIGRPPL